MRTVLAEVAVDRWAAPTTHQLRIFLVLADELHFGRAAALMFMTQPALSRQFDALERRLGVQLIARTNRSAELTPAGQAILPEARAVVDAMRGLRRVTRGHLRAVAGHLVIGTAEASMPYTQAILDELRRGHPDLTFEVRPLDLVEQYESLLADEVDAVFCRPPVPEGIATIQLATEPRVVCLSADDPLAELPEIRLARLRDHPVVSYPSECPQVWRDFWTVAVRPDDTAVGSGPVVRDVETLLTTVALGEAIAFLPAVARRFLPRPGIAFLDVIDLSPCLSALAWHAANGDRPTITALRRAAETARNR
ncbi:LysR family transcriptional regulator [Herbihabitans rhizosphaerae]|nr:LysR family transcriptional regulator [Herbihabitans rhizosphaerae]